MIVGPLIHRVRKVTVEAVSRIRANASPGLSFSFALIQSTMAVRRTATTIAANSSKSMTRPIQASMRASTSPTASSRTKTTGLLDSPRAEVAPRFAHGDPTISLLRIVDTVSKCTPLERKGL